MMNKLILLVLLLTAGCATGFPTPRTQPNTLLVENNSGGVVRIFLHDGNQQFRLGRAYPGDNCMKIWVASEKVVAFGIQHLADRQYWSGRIFQNAPNRGWYLEINSPLAAKWDMISLIPTAQC